MPDDSCTLIRFDGFHTVTVSKEKDGKLFVIDAYTARDPFRIDINENYDQWRRNRHSISYLVGRKQKTVEGVGGGGSGRRWVAINLLLLQKKKSLVKTIRRRS